MIFTDARLARQLERWLERVLIVEPNQASAQLVSELLKGAGAKQINHERSIQRALSACRVNEPHIVVTEVGGANLEGLAFVRNLRRSDLPCRQAPVIVVTAEATARTIVAARNAGVHEFLRKPFTARDLARRLEVATLHPRDWIEAVGYVGPDRRRFNAGDYQGPRKRISDQTASTPAERIEQAVRIAKAAIGAIEMDAAQALRSLRAQASELKRLGASEGDAKLVAAADKLDSALSDASADAGLSRPAIEAAAADLWDYLPGEPSPPARAVA
jgi:DNA-binding response OmpR family regulator